MTRILNDTRTLIPNFMPLLYVVMAVGCMFAKTEHENTMLDMKGYQEAMEQG